MSPAPAPRVSCDAGPNPVGATPRCGGGRRRAAGAFRGRPPAGASAAAGGGRRGPPHGCRPRPHPHCHDGGHTRRPTTVTANARGPFRDRKGPLGCCALGRIRTCNLLIRSQVLYPLSYERLASRRFFLPVGVAGTTLHDLRREAKSIPLTPSDLHKRPDARSFRVDPRRPGAWWNRDRAPREGARGADTGRSDGGTRDAGGTDGAHGNGTPCRNAGRARGPGRRRTAPQTRPDIRRADPAAHTGRSRGDGTRRAEHDEGPPVGSTGGPRTCGGGGI